MLEQINYEDILIIGISAGMTMALVTRLLSYIITAFRMIVKDCADV